jgi:hypothetical protein
LVTLQPIYAAPGVTKAVSDYAAEKALGYVATTSGLRTGQGRWIGATNVEFIAGFPQKIAGWNQATAAKTVDPPRASLVWRDNDGNPRLAVGTETHLYYFDGTNLVDITPLRALSDGTLTNPITTNANSTIVAITDSSQVLQNGDWVFLSAAASVGGVLLDNWYPVSSRTGSGYNITIPVAATSGAGPGGGAVVFQYPRINLSGPFTTTMGSETVIVAQTAHGAVTGNYVIFSGASPVGGITLNGEYLVTVTGVNSYTVQASSPATSNASGGGTVSVVFEINVQQSSFTTAPGYGTGAYGAGPYSAGQTLGPVLANGWTLDAYGYQLLAAPIGGTIYIYDPSVGGVAYPMLNAPPTLIAMFVTAERFVVALGITGNLLELAWCDQNDYTDWTSTPTNTANTGRTLIGGSYFVGGIKVTNGVSLLWSDRCCFEMNYTGDNEVYATPIQGNNCGLVDPTAVVVVGGIAYWQSDRDFWSWSGGVTVLPTDDIRQYVYGDPASTGQPGINTSYLSYCTAGSNRAKRQIRFFYPTASATEVNAGLIYQIDAQCWSNLDFGKTTYTDANLFAYPISTDTTGMIYYEESGTDANGTALDYNLEFGDLDLQNGAQNADVLGFIPDAQYIAGPCSLTINTKYYPSDSYTVDGPYTMTVPSGSNYVLSGRIDLRSQGKLFGFSIEADAIGATFRLGLPRLDIQPAGARN